MPVPEFSELLEDVIIGIPSALEFWVKYSSAKEFSMEQIKIAEEAFSKNPNSANIKFLQGLWLEYGVGRPINMSQALKAYSNAGEDSPAALHALGSYYFKNNQFKKAEAYYISAIEHHHVPSMLFMAKIYEESEISKTIDLYEIAIALDSPIAMIERARLHQKEGEDQNYLRAKNLLILAAEITGDSSHIEQFYLNQIKNTTPIKNLYTHIEILRGEGEKLKVSKNEKDRAEGDKFVTKAAELSKRLDNFLLEGLKEPHTGEDEKAFKKVFHDVLHANDSDLRVNKPLWKTLVQNIGLALTGLGLIAIIGKAVAHLSENKPFSIRDAVYFSRTAKGDLQNEIDKSLDRESLIPEQPKGPS